VSNAEAVSYSNTAYNTVVKDILPRNLAPAALADVVATAGGRALVKDEDYTFDYVYNPTTRRGEFTFATQQAAAGFPARIDAGEDLVLTYALTVDPGIGAEGSGVGLMANRAQVEGYASFPATLNDD